MSFDSCSGAKVVGVCLTSARTFHAAQSLQWVFVLGAHLERNPKGRFFEVQRTESGVAEELGRGAREHGEWRMTKGANGLETKKPAGETKRGLCCGLFGCLVLPKRLPGWTTLFLIPIKAGERMLTSSVRLTCTKVKYLAERFWEDFSRGREILGKYIVYRRSDFWKKSNWTLWFSGIFPERGENPEDFGGFSAKWQKGSGK